MNVCSNEFLKMVLRLPHYFPSPFPLVFHIFIISASNRQVEAINDDMTTYHMREHMIFMGIMMENLRVATLQS